MIGKDEVSLLTLLYKTQDYADKFGLEINPKPTKSEVLTFQKEEQEWPLRNCEGVLIANLKQATTYKYLGIPVTLQGQKIFKFRTKYMVVGANQYAGRIKRLAKDSFNRIEVGEAIWENIAIPVLLYGAECLSMTAAEIIYM